MHRDLKQIEKDITRKRGFVALKNAEEPKDLAELLRRLISTREQTVIRYKNGKEAKNPQCTSNRRRSAEDAYLVAKPLFPDITLEHVDKALLKLAADQVFYRSYCGTVKRIVHVSHVGGAEAIKRIRTSLGDLNVTHERPIITKPRKPAK